MEAGEAIAQATVTRLQGSGQRRTRAEDARSLAFPVIVSTALHGLAALVIAMLAAGGARVDAPPPRSTIQATLASPAPRFVVPSPSLRPHPCANRRSVRRRNRRRARAAEPSRGATPEPTSQGQVIIGVLGTGEAVDGAVESRRARSCIRAPCAPRRSSRRRPPASIRKPRWPIDASSRSTSPSSCTRTAASSWRRATFDDTVFAPAIRAALATAKARPLEVNGQVKTSWALVSFTFEYVGAR